MNELESQKRFGRFTELLENSGVAYAVDRSEYPAAVRDEIRFVILEFNAAWGHAVKQDSEFTWEYLYNIVEDPRCGYQALSELKTAISGGAKVALDLSDEAIIHVNDCSSLPYAELSRFDSIVIPHEGDWILVIGHEPIAEFTLIYPIDNKAIAFY